VTDIFQRFVADISNEYGYFCEEEGNTVSIYKSAQSVETGAQKIGNYKDTKTSTKWAKAAISLIAEIAAA